MTPSVTRPPITVVVPVYNRRDLLARALRSLQAQTFADFEVVVVDDGSSDDPQAVVESLAGPRVSFVRQRNAGPAAARNNGCRHSRTPYITFLDSDDEALPDWLEQMVAALRAPGVGAVSCGIYLLGDEPDGSSRLIHDDLPRPVGPMFPGQVALFTNGGSFAVRRDVFERVGGFDELLRSGEHTELGLRLIPAILERGGTLAAVMEPLIRVHVHTGARASANPVTKYEGASRTLEKHKALFARDPEHFANYHAVAGVNAARLGRFDRARHHFLTSVRIHPWRLEHWARAAAALLPGLMRRRWYRGARPERHAALERVPG
jgi:glycosyltransferase involved in cell wall biosynthesis